jgi:RNA polymerase sigma-70 factor (ECF subfamily)
MPFDDPLRNWSLSWQELQDASDEEVARQLYLGNDDALAVIVDRYQQLVFAVALRIIKDHSEAEDVVQIVFLDIFRKVEQFNPGRGTLKTWLLHYAYSRAINRRHYLESRCFYSQVEIDESVLGHSVPEGTKPLWSGEASRLVHQGMQLLNQKQQRAIALLYFEGLKAEEAAEKTGETAAALRHHYYRGLMKLRAFVNATAAQKESNATEPDGIRLEVADADPRPI